MEILLALLTAILSSVPALAQEPIDNQIIRESKPTVAVKTTEQADSLHLVATDKVQLGDTFYFTPYNLVESQTDASPCIGASTKDLCYLNSNGTPTMALTVDVRRKYGIKRGDKIRLEGDPGCAGEYTVEDEMSKRFRTGCIKRKGYCIKGDVVNRAGGVCKIVF